MIKWFDADKFLPGREVDQILVRVMNYMSNITTHAFELAVYSDGKWNINGSFLNENTFVVTHWAHINEPFE